MTSLSKIMDGYREALKVGIYDFSKSDHVDEFFRELDDKIPKNCELWKILDQGRVISEFQGVAYKPKNFDQWCQQIMTCIAKWPRGTVEKVNVADGGSHELLLDHDG